MAVKANETEKFKAEMVQFAETASQMIKQGIQAMQSQVETVGKDLFKKAIESIGRPVPRPPPRSPPRSLPTRRPSPMRTKR